MKVAVWGSYNYGNYGDDLMALQFAESLKRLGVNPCVYRLDKEIAERHSINTTHSIEELLENARFCIIGGGGMLVGKSDNTAKNQKPSNQKSVSGSIDNDFRELHLTSSRVNCPVYPISVGGDGRGAETPLPEWREAFWMGPACKRATVRLKEDIALVNKLGKEAIYYPDVLLTISDLWDLEPLPKSSGQLHVGINIANTKRGQFLAFQLSVIAQLRKDIVFHFIGTHLPNAPVNYELIPGKESAYIKQHVYTDPQSTLRFLKSLDLVVSSKLHLGLTALALDVPFYSYRGAGKTRTFLKSINSEFAIWQSNDFNLVSFLTNPNRIIEAKKQFDFKALEESKNLSRGHLNFVQELVKKES